jgi:hypothetical protein
MFTDFDLTLKVDSYIAHPYWPEVDQMVNIQKASGFNRAKSELTRDKALRGYLEKIGMSYADYEALVKLAHREWYRQNGEDSPIIIPRHQFAGCLVQSCTSAPAGCKFPKDAFRSLVQVGDLLTQKRTHDTVYKRFVRPSDAKTGKPISNQRSLRENAVIEAFEATGTLALDMDNVKPDSVKGLLKYAGKYTGLGASRKMGYGRFTVKEFAGAGG